jgi:hypothetical protein
VAKNKAGLILLPFAFSHSLPEIAFLVKGLTLSPFCGNFDIEGGEEKPGFSPA